MSKSLGQEILQVNLLNITNISLLISDSGTSTQRSMSQASAASMAPVTEQQIVHALSEHAHKIAETILTNPESGTDLVQDAQVGNNLLR